jgi:GR25 family glycosyltransferase involved in LPS biosynthesis
MVPLTKCLIVIGIMVFIVAAHMYIVNKATTIKVIGTLPIQVPHVKVVTIPNRVEYAEGFLQALNLSKENIHPAVLKSDVQEPELHEAGLLSKSPQKIINKGEIACYLSHVKVYDYIISNQLPFMLIVEDDVYYDHENVLAWRTSVIERLNVVFSAVKQDAWDILFLGRCWDMCSRQLLYKPGVVRTMFPGCTHAYVVSLRGARKLRDTAFPIVTSLDRHIKSLTSRNQLFCIASETNIFLQDRRMASELGHEREKLRLCMDNAQSEYASVQ